MTSHSCEHNNNADPGKLPVTYRRRMSHRCALLVLGLWSLAALADYFDDVGYSALQAEVGASLEDGTGVPVGHVEAAVTVNGTQAWYPNPGSGEFSGKTLTDVSGAPDSVYSGHATSVGKKFYGNTQSTSGGVTSILVYLADHWVGTGFLRSSTAPGLKPPPLPSASRVSNHSYVGSAGSADTDILARLDWVIETDEMLHVAGFNGTNTSPLMGSAYNVISANDTAHPTSNGSASGGGIYVAGRTKPELVAPESNTSGATPRVASAAALLVDLAHNSPSLSTDPVSVSMINRNGDTIYNAERTEVIKAALMAGADRSTSNTTSVDITDYRVNAIDQTANGLDRRYGAGQLNVYDSYQIIAAGEQNSEEDQPAGMGMVAASGFDYDPAFGGAGGSNAAATYYFSPTPEALRLTASLVWNLDIDGGSAFSFDGTGTLYDLDLVLFDVTDPGNWVLVASSTSTIDNTENLWLLLDPGKDYALRVQPGTGQAAFNWDYGLAWRLESLPVPLSIDPVVLPDAYWNEAYPPQTLTATGGQPPYSWTIIAGALPPGMTLSSDGVISGTPTVAGTASFTVQASDAASATATENMTLAIKTRGYVCGFCHQ